MTDPAAFGPMDPPPSYVAAPPPPPAKRTKRLAVGTAAVVAVAAGAFGVLTLSAGDGADDAGAAVETMFDAIDDEDVIGVLESLEPNERQILRPAVEDAGQQAQRVNLASDDLNLRDVAGVDIEVKGMTYTTENLGDGITAVDLTGGTVSSATDLDAMPFGSTIRTILDRDAAEQDDTVDRTSDATIELDGVRMVALRSDGGWHVSALYSIAEAVRLDQDDVRPVPDFGNGVPAKGADIPEQAVRDAVAAAVDLNVQRLIELTPPGEAAMLHDYGPMLVDAAKDARDDDFQGPKVENLELKTADGPDGSQVVSAASYKISYGDDYSSTTMEYDGSCSTVTYTYTDTSYDESGGTLTPYGPDGEIVDDGSSQLPPDAITPYPVPQTGSSEPQTDSYKVCDTGVSSDVNQLFPVGAIFNGPGGQVKVVTEQHDGSWYVSPTRTIIESTIGGLRDLSPEQVETAARVLGGDYWLAQPDSFWEACGVARPGFDASRDGGNQAFEDCYDSLPDDYEPESGLYGYGFGFFGMRSGEESFEEVGTSIDEGRGGSYPGDECYGGGQAYRDPATDACMANLHDTGQMSDEEYLGYTCSEAYERIEVADDASDEESDAAYNAADKAYDACIDAGLPDGVSSGSDGGTAATTAPSTGPPVTPTSVPDGSVSASVPETTTVGG